MDKKLHTELAAIREKHYQREKQDRFLRWVNDYDDHLKNMYQIVLLYYNMTYDDFVNMVYVCSI